MMKLAGRGWSTCQLETKSTGARQIDVVIATIILISSSSSIIIMQIWMWSGGGTQRD